MKPVEFPDFPYASTLTEVIIELEKMRGELKSPSPDQSQFDELKSLFQLMTSVTSSRIEGNRTTILDVVAGAALSANLDDRKTLRVDDGVSEILQIRDATDFIDEEVRAGTIITHGHVRELHRIATEGLRREGDRTPGSYRQGDVSITGSKHAPPAPGDVHADMSMLLEFLNTPVQQRFQLLKLALAHHRFVWIHPFNNGNGRVGRLLTYATLRTMGFQDISGYRTLNLTAVFGADREKYYERLEDADSLSAESLVRWAEYVLGGLLADLKRSQLLANPLFVNDQIIVPAVRRALDSGRLSQQESGVLLRASSHGTVKAADLSDLLPGSAATRSQAIRRFLDAGLLVPTEPGKRSYRMAMSPNRLTPFLVRELASREFLPVILEDGY